MEEKNKKKRMLYVLLGAVALLIVLVGGTYAYFSASVSNSNTIGGNTQNINNNSLTLTVKKVVFNGTSAPSNDLVPAYFGTCGSGDVSTYGCTADGIKVIDPAHLKVAQVSSMLTNKCEQDGFTGCHVYQINISADQNITHANLLLNLSVSNLNGASSIENKNQWGYVVFGADGTVDSSTGATSGLTNPVLNANNGAPAAIGNGVTNLDIHNDSTLSSTVVTYYLLVYLNDTGASQNNVVSNSGDANYAVGSYSGTLELQALGGKVRACFTPNGVCEAEVSNGTLMSRLFYPLGDVNDNGIEDEHDRYIFVSDNIFGREMNSNSIVGIYTVNHTNIPANAAASWDVSEEQNGSVMAWLIEDNSGEDPVYDLYIGQEGGVKAPSDSSDLFAGFVDANIIDLSYLDTQNVTNMFEMFWGCGSVTTLDLSNFNFNSIVEHNGNIQGLFDGAYNLTTITCAAEDEEILCNQINEAESIGVTINGTRQCEGESGNSK